MKIAIVSGKAKWVVDAIANDFRKYTSLEVVGLRESPDVVWVLNFWSLPSVIGRFKNVVAQVHHVNTEKLEKYNFDLVNACQSCIVPNQFTYEFMKVKTKTPVVKMPYWLLSDRMKDPIDKERIQLIRKDGKVVIGSFQKDSENRTGKPKLIKGPDILVDVLSRVGDIKVVLAGYNREYVTAKLKQKGIPFDYFQMDDDLNGLYDSLDWYLVTSRVEGGPQAVLEAAYRKVKILSTPVGIAPEILHPDCLCKDSDDFVAKIEKNVDKRMYNYDKMQDYLPSKVVKVYDEFFKQMR